MVESLAGPPSGSRGWHLPDAAATAELGRAVAAALNIVVPPSLVVYLEGDLGAGKTALVRAILAGLGHDGRVPSPTYTLVEPYRLERFRVLHVDLYRLRDPAELEDLGLQDELGLADDEGRGSLLLAEWPRRAADRLPAPDLLIGLVIEGEGRQATLTPGSVAGAEVLGEMRRGPQAAF